ncbi:MAG: prolipoprotein diacylglyceryl transferase [Chitinophagales bacterium]|nr:prolipoprotein diacylglyceryl transferase [Chitinophagales bacterium]
MFLSYITWNVSPTLIDLGVWKLQWYGFLWASCIILAYYLLLYANRHEPAENRHGTAIIEYVFFGGLIGARLGEVLLYNPSHYWAHPIEILYIWQGGLASHGGAIGILVASFLYVYRFGYSYIRLLDVLALGMPFFGALIRIGNLMNSEIIGKATTVPWGFVFVRQGETIARHPVVLYEALWLTIVGIVLWRLYLGKRRAAGFIAGLFFVLTFSGRFCLEFWKANADFTQLLNLPLIVLGGILLWYSVSGGKKSANE